MVASSTDLAPHPDAPMLGDELAEHYAGCFACGQQAVGGLGMRFRVVGELELESLVVLAASHQGAPGLAHGGVLSAMFDEALGALQVFVQEPAVTASLTTDFRAPVPIGAQLHVRSRLDGRNGRKLHVSAQARLGAPDGPVAATAHGLFLVVPAEHFTRHGRPEDVAAAQAAGAAPRPFAHGPDA